MKKQTYGIAYVERFWDTLSPFEYMEKIRTLIVGYKDSLKDREDVLTKYRARATLDKQMRVVKLRKTEFDGTYRVREVVEKLSDRLGNVCGKLCVVSITAENRGIPFEIICTS